MGNYNFTGTTKIITPADPPVGGVIDIDVQDLYSRWVDWFLTSDNSKYLPAMRAVGGDPLPGSKQLGLTYFLMNGWRLRPYEANHTMNVDGNLYTEEGVSPFISTIGTYNVTVISAVSNLVDSTVQQLPEIEHASFGGAVHVKTDSGYSGTTFPTGTPRQPVNNLTDALSIATTRGLGAFFLHSAVTIGSQFNGFSFAGHVGSSITLDNTSNVIIRDTMVYGTVERARIYDCFVGNIVVTGVTHFYNSSFAGDLTLDSAFCVIVDSEAGKTGQNSVTVDFNSTASILEVRGFRGNITLKNKNGSQPTDLHMTSGKVIIDSTVTGGAITISGNAIVENNGTATLDTTRLIQADKIIDIHEETFGKWVLNPSAKTMTLYKPDGIAILKQFNLTEASGNVPAYVERVPA